MSEKEIVYVTDRQERHVMDATGHDEVNHPKHYEVLPGVEAIDIIQSSIQGRSAVEAWMLGNALKYLLRSNKKHNEPLTDLKKAKNYLHRLIIELERDA